MTLPRRAAALLAVAAVSLGLLASASTASASTYANTTRVQSGDWRTLLTVVGAPVNASFRCPANAQIRVRYGWGTWWTGAYNVQTQTLNCSTYKYLYVYAAQALEGARIQIKVPYSTYVSWTYWM